MAVTPHPPPPEGGCRPVPILQEWHAHVRKKFSCFHRKERTFQSLEEVCVLLCPQHNICEKMRVSNTQPNQLPIWASGQSRTDRLNKVVCMYGCRHGTNNHCDILINHCMYMHNHDVVMPPKFNWQCILLQFSLISVYLQSFTKTWCNASRVTYRRPHSRERWKLDYKPTNNPVQIGIPIKPVEETRRTRSKIPVMTITNAAINCKGETNPRSRRGDRIAMMIIKEVSHAKALGTQTM